MTLFHCRHSDYTWPQKDKATGELRVSCLQCGASLKYDWNKMEVVVDRETVATS